MANTKKAKGLADGLFPVRAILKPNFGEEVVLHLQDQTPFMDELHTIDPFNLMLTAGEGLNEFGPLCFLVFWIHTPGAFNEAFASYDIYLNPHSKAQLSIWRKLAAQNYWRLFLIGSGGQQRGLYEFENTFNLGATLDSVVEACGPIPMVDFKRAKAKFKQEHPVDELLKMG